MSYSKLDITKFVSPSVSQSRHQFQGLAHLAELAYRYDDMCVYMKAVVEAAKGGPDLTLDERNLLSVAYKNAAGTRRAAWRSLHRPESGHARLIWVYRQQVESELETYCLEIIHLLEDVLIDHPASDDESKVFYRKMAGDYYRYLAEFKTDRQLKIYQEKSAEFYGLAMEIANRIMTPANPIRLGLALNYSVCLYEIMRLKRPACELAHNALNDALRSIDNADSSQYRDSRLILNLLRDNLALWEIPDEE